ncbi:hypothetical protein KCU73_g9203, partial [Aureobasidium melanogenum]
MKFNAVSLVLTAVVVALAVIAAPVGGGSRWRRASIGLGVSIYKADDVTVKDMISYCVETTDDGKKQLSNGPDCFAGIAFFLFRTAAYTAAVASAVVEIKGFTMGDAMHDELKRRDSLSSNDTVLYVNSTMWQSMNESITSAIPYQPTAIHFNSDVVLNGTKLLGEVPGYQLEHHTNQTHSSLRISPSISSTNSTNSVNKRNHVEFKGAAGFKLNYVHNCNNNRVYEDSYVQMSDLRQLSRDFAYWTAYDGGSDVMWVEMYNTAAGDKDFFYGTLIAERYDFGDNFEGVEWPATKGC